VSHIRRIFLVALVMMVPQVVHAEATVGHVVLVSGAATLQQISNAPVEAKFGADVHKMDTLETHNGKLKILFNDKTLLTLGANTKVLVTEHFYNKKRAERSSVYDIVHGTVRAIVDKPGDLKTNDVQLQTPTAVAGIRGTDVAVHAAGKSARMACFNGAFKAYAKSNPENGVMVKTGEWTDISGPTPTKPLPVTASALKQFSDVMNGESVEDILNQLGAGALSETPEKIQPQPQHQEQPPQLPYLPGGNTNTPSDAGTGGDSPTPPGE